MEIERGGSDPLLLLLLLLMMLRLFLASWSWRWRMDVVAFSMLNSIGNSLGGWLERNISKSDLVFLLIWSQLVLEVVHV